MITEGIEQLVERPHLIDLDYVVPKLTDTNNFLRIIEICMLKLQKLGEIPSSEDKMLQCSDIVLEMFKALNKSINTCKDWKLLDNFKPNMKGMNK
jgi:hypothetical protein